MQRVKDLNLFYCIKFSFLLPELCYSYQLPYYVFTWCALLWTCLNLRPLPLLCSCVFIQHVVSMNMYTPEMWLDIGMLPYKINCTITSYTGFRVIGWVIVQVIMSEWVIVGLVIV